VTVVDSRFYTNTVRAAVAAPSTALAADNHGGAFYCNGGTLRVTGTVFAGNKGSYKRYLTTTDAGGGAGYLTGACSAEIRNCIFLGNETWTGETREGDGGALWVGVTSASTVLVANCTFNANKADWYGGAFFAKSGNLEIEDSILWANLVALQSGSEIYAKDTAALTVSYSDLTNTNTPYVVTAGSATLTWGEGILMTDPVFASATDFHLKSRYGRWDPVALTWVIDAAGSPCIDAGDPASPWQNEPASNGRRVNQGAYGNTWQASMSAPPRGSVVMVR
jgi:hypothetical protein